MWARALRRSRDRAMRVRWVAAVGRQVAMSSSYWRDGPLAGLLDPGGLPPAGDAAAGVREGDLEDLDAGAGAGRRERGQGAAPAVDAAGLLLGGEQDVCRVPDQGDRGEGLGVGVVDHRGPGGLVDEEPQRGGVAGQGEGPGGAGLAGPGPVVVWPRARRSR